VPVGDCYFRKTIMTGGEVEFAQIHAACDNQYELFVNGQPAGRGADWRKMDVHDVTKLMRAGLNVVAVKATNLDEGAAGMVVRVIVKERGGTYENFSTDDSWRTSVKEFANWKAPEFRDRIWLPAKVYGPLGGVLPWGDEVVISDEGSRFLIDPEFAIERLVTDEQAGSLIAMGFNAKGDILASQEGGPLLLIRDADRDGTFESAKPFCSELKNVQGILSLGAYVLAVEERRWPIGRNQGAREVPRPDRRTRPARGADRPRRIDLRVVRQFRQRRRAGQPQEPLFGRVRGRPRAAALRRPAGLRRRRSRARWHHFADRH
jgi:hypothetical protein